MLAAPLPTAKMAHERAGMPISRGIQTIEIRDSVGVNELRFSKELVVEVTVVNNYRTVN
jgi:hypothetical protein